MGAAQVMITIQNTLAQPFKKCFILNDHQISERTVGFAHGREPQEKTAMLRFNDLDTPENNRSGDLKLDKCPGAIGWITRVEWNDPDVDHVQ